MTPARSPAIEWALIGAVWLAVVGAAAGWLAIDRHPPEWDYANHLERAIECERDLAVGDVRTVLARSSFYPPLVPCLGGLAYRLFPSDVAFGQIVIFAFLGLGMAATYRLARRFTDGPGAVVAAVLLGTAPVVVNQALRFQLDVPLAAMVAVALEALLWTEGFRRAVPSVLAGLALGLGMLTKPSFAVYVAPALALALLAVPDRRAMANAAAAVVVAIAVALPWYGPRLLGLPLQAQNRSFRQAAEAGFPDALSSASLAYYPRTLPLQLGLVGVVLVGCGVIVAVWRRHWYVLAALTPLVGFFLIQNKQLRYTLPLVPAAAVLAGIGLSGLPRALRRVALVAVAAAAIVQVSSTVYALPPALRLPGTTVALTDPSPPSRAEWQQRPILALIARDAGDRAALVSVPPNAAWFSIANFRYYSVRDGRPLRFLRAWDDEPIAVEYMILKTGDVGPPWTADKPRRIAARFAADSRLDTAFPVLGEFALPDGSRATVRGRRVPVVAAPAETLARALAAAFRRRADEFARDVDELDVAVEPDDELQRGRARRVVITARAATLGDMRRRGAALLRAHDVRLVLDDFVFNPQSLLGERRLDPLDLRRLRLERLTVLASDFDAFLAATPPRGRPRVTFGAGFADVHVVLLGPDIRARVRFVSAVDRPFALSADAVSLGGVPVPGFFVGWVMNMVDPSRGIAARLPFPVDVAAIAIAPGGVTVGGS